ncbi:hypothetical protein J0809_21070 [Bacillus paranthracis]
MRVVLYTLNFYKIFILYESEVILIKITQLDIDKMVLRLNVGYNGFKFKESDLKDGELKDWAKKNNLLKSDDKEKD